MAVAIPQDIIDCIIEAVDDDRLVLKKCALLSSSFLLPCRKRLFSSIYLHSEQGCQRLHQFLVENPVIQSFIQSITMGGLKLTYYLKLNGTSLIGILRLPFCWLEEFSYIPWDYLHWNDFSSELKDSFSAIIHSPTLKTVYIHNILNLPSMLFQGTHLTDLHLHSVNFVASEQPKPLIPETLERETVVERCKWTFNSSSRGHTEPIFMPFLSRLRVFEIYVDPSSAFMDDFSILFTTIRSLRLSLTSPGTLEHLNIFIVFEGNNNLFNYSTFFDDLRGAEGWRDLDSIITHPIGSRLQRVDIGVSYSFLFDYDLEECDAAEVAQPILDALPRLRDSGILFVEVTP